MGPVREDQEGEVFREMDSIRGADPSPEICRLKYAGRILDFSRPKDKTELFREKTTQVSRFSGC